MVLVTDGQHNSGVHYKEMYQLLKDKNIVADVITISQAADKNVQQVAIETDGAVYHASEEDNVDLVQIMEQIGESSKHVAKVNSIPTSYVAISLYDP